MGHLRYFEKSKLLNGETVVSSLDGWIGEVMGKGDKAQHNGALVLTTQRVAFIRKGLFGEVFETIPLAKITSVESRSFMGYKVATVHTSHDALTFKTFESKNDFAAVVDAIESRVESSRQGATAVRLPTEFVRELEALAALRRSGAITDDEYGRGKRQLLGQVPFEANSVVREPMVGARDTTKRKEAKSSSFSGALTLAAAIGMVWFAWSAFSSDRPSRAEASTPAKIVTAESYCDDGKAGSDKVYAITGSYDPRSTPSESGARLKNDKATDVLGTQQFHTIDNSTTVKQLCTNSQWSKVAVVTPTWLSDVEGWIPTSKLRNIDKAKGGQRIYADEDFYWDKYTSPYKKQIIKIVNDIAQKQPGCSKLDPITTSLSGSKSSSGDPVFYVTCTPKGNPFNIWFRPTGYDSVMVE